MLFVSDDQQTIEHKTTKYKYQQYFFTW